MMKKKDHDDEKGSRLLIIATLGCAVVEKDDCDQLVVVVTLGCATTTSLAPHCHGPRMCRSGK
jgi:hypothetical protein